MLIPAAASVASLATLAPLNNDTKLDIPLIELPIEPAILNPAIAVTTAPIAMAVSFISSVWLDK